MKKKFYFTFEEFLSVIPFIRDSLVRDLAFYTAFSSVYDQDYVDALNLLIAELDSIVENKIKIKEVKVMTKDIYDKMILFRELLNFMDSYLLLATGLTVAPKDWPFKQTRKCITNKNVDGAILGLLGFKQLIDDNFDALEAVGYTDVKFVDFKTKLTALSALNETRNLKIEEKVLVINDNIVFFNKVFDQIRTIAKVGKNLFRISAPKKADDYTISKLLKRITHHVGKDAKVKPDAWIQGTLTDLLSGAKLKGVSVWTDSCNTVVITDENGFFKIGVTADITKMIFATLKNYIIVQEDIVIMKGITLQHDMEMEMVPLSTESA
ncbi:MAG: hypothetical protein WCH34_17905 [Bacteroidota bacterium]